MLGKNRLHKSTVLSVRLLDQELALMCYYYAKEKWVGQVQELASSGN